MKYQIMTSGEIRKARGKCIHCGIIVGKLYRVSGLGRELINMCGICTMDELAEWKIFENAIRRPEDGGFYGKDDERSKNFKERKD